MRLVSVMQVPAGPAQLKQFKDPVFRISNLYSIRTREGKVIPFRPRPQQLQVLDMLYRQKLKRVCILKARQLGFSTLLGIVCLDQLCWSVGRQVSLVDKTQEDARQKLKNIVALAYDSLHAELKARFLVDRANAGEFGVRFHEYDSAQTSTMYAATHARGGSNSLLWISEWGYIQATDLRRSEEILTGAIPSAKNGTIVVETTWRGGRGGHLWEIVKKALETPEEQKQPDDWRVVFFPWQNDPDYFDSEPQALTAETIRYFSDKPGFSLGQMSWYQRARTQFGMFVARGVSDDDRGVFPDSGRGRHLCRVDRQASCAGGHPPGGCRHFRAGAHRLGSGFATQYRGDVLSDHRRRDSRDRL